MNTASWAGESTTTDEAAATKRHTSPAAVILTAVLAVGTIVAALFDPELALVLTGITVWSIAVLRIRSLMAGRHTGA